MEKSILRVISARNFLTFNSNKELNMEKSGDNLILHLSLGNGMQSEPVLVDCSEKPYPLSNKEILQLVTYLTDSTTAFDHKIAILAQKNTRLDKLRFFDHVAHIPGLQLQVFNDYSQAIEWLTVMT